MILAKQKCRFSVGKLKFILANLCLALPKRICFCKFLFLNVGKYNIGNDGVGSLILLGGTKSIENQR